MLPWLLSRSSNNITINAMAKHLKLYGVVLMSTTMEKRTHISIITTARTGGTGKGYDESKRYTQTDKYKIKYLLRNTVWNTQCTQCIRYGVCIIRIFYSERVSCGHPHCTRPVHQFSVQFFKPVFPIESEKIKTEIEEWGERAARRSAGCTDRLVSGRYTEESSSSLSGLTIKYLKAIKQADP